MVEITDLKGFANWLGIGNNTTKRYIWIVQQYLNWLGDREMTVQSLQDWILSLNVSSSSKVKYYQAVKQYFFYLGRAKEIFEAQAEKRLRLPKNDTKEPPLITPEQIMKVIQCAHNIRDKALIAVKYDCGLRLDELINLDRKDVNFETKEIFIQKRKGGKGQLVPINDYPLELLKKYLEKRRDKHPALFTTLNGRIDESTVRKIIRNAGRAAGIPFPFKTHLTRHARAIHMRQAGVPIETIKDFLGHCNINTTLIYARYSTADIKVPAEKSKIWSSWETSIEELRREAKRS